MSVSIERSENRAAIASAASAGNTGGDSLEALIDVLPGAAFIFRKAAPGGLPSFSFVSGKVQELLDLSPDALLLEPQTLFDRIERADADCLLRDVDRAFANRASWCTQIRLRSGADVKALECCGCVVEDAHGDAVAYGYFTDSAERLRLEHQSLLWTSLFEESSEGIMICAADLRICIVNEAFRAITGYSNEEVIGQTPCILHSGRQTQDFYRSMWASISTTGRWSGEIWNRRKNGEHFAEWLIVHAVSNNRGEITNYIGIFSDLTRRKEAEERIQHLAQYDALTELPNRGRLMLRLRDLIDAAARTQGKLGILSVDLDRFRNVNDSMGHDAGDVLLKTIATRLKCTVRKSDIVARMGGDEFVILIPDAAGPADLRAVAANILESLGEPVLLRGQLLVVSASIGGCLYPDDGISADELTRNASVAMKRAKRVGSDVMEFYATGMNNHAADRLRMENDLRLAIDRDELRLHYQPQVDLASGAIIGAEALVRWQRPGVGLLAPGEFIPLAEERGLILPLGRWVVREAMRQLAAWDAAGLPRLAVSVNLTANEFHREDVVEELSAIVAEHALSPSRVDLELTESIAVQDLESTRRTLCALHERGFRLSLDDFGTGYSSLSYLRHFPVDRIKIDRSFIHEITADQASVRIVRAIIALAKSLGMKVIAEGVETQQQRDALCAEQCDELQGFLASPPLPPDEFERLVMNWRS